MTTRRRILSFWALVGMAFLVGLIVLSMFLLMPPAKKPVPETPAKWWDVPRD